MTRRALGTRVCSHFQVPAPIAARVQRTQVPFLGQAHAIGRQGRQAGFVECEAGAYQVATASLTRDVVVRRWALDEQLTEDADGAGRQLKLARDPAPFYLPCRVSAQALEQQANKFPGFSPSRLGMFPRCSVSKRRGPS